MASTSCNALTPDQKVAVLQRAKNQLMSVCSLVDHFSCGKSEITAILKNKDSIFNIYKSNMRS